jgi:CDP-diacylglycerol--serine O-phosphatidyltransferase
VRFVTALVVVLAFIVVSTHPPQILFGGFLAYALSGPVFTLVQRRRRRAARRAHPAQCGDEPRRPGGGEGA